MARPGRDDEIEDIQILEAIALLPGPAVGTTEVGNLLGMSQQGIYKRLRGLEDDQLVETKMAGGSRIWWLTLAGQEYVARRLLDGYD